MVDKHSWLSGIKSLSRRKRRRLPKTSRIVREFYRSISHYRNAADQMEQRFMRQCWYDVERSTAQLFQDCFALSVASTERSGYFCEFGATDGRTLSNSFMLEHDYGWRGILAEPSRGWVSRLNANRPTAAIDGRCVWRASGELLEFTETASGEFSTLAHFESSDLHQARRANVAGRYVVETVSLDDLLDEHDAPPIIDYLSIDTEGSEFEILNAFDFSKRRINVITVEHNFTEQRERLHDLLTANKFVLKLPHWSRWDAWYVHQDLER